MNKNLQILSDTDLDNVCGGAEPLSTGECVLGMVACAAFGSLTSLLCYYEAKKAHNMTFGGNDYNRLRVETKPDIVVYNRTPAVMIYN